jgi:RHS repeat-associated protein
VSNLQYGVFSGREYEAGRDLITQVLNKAGANIISRFDYTNDELGRRTERVDTLAVTNVFGYNVRSELVSADMGTNQYGYAYDPIGNRRVATNNAEVLTYLSNALNQYTNISDGVTNTPTYDLDGNMLTHGGWTYAWDGENRLTMASNGTMVVRFNYDFMSRRYQKVVGTTTNRFIFDGWNLIREITDTATPPYSLTNFYVWARDLSGTSQGAGGIGGLLASFISTNSLQSTVCFTSFDANGNVTDLVGTNGSSLAHYEYGPYGDVVAQSGTLADENSIRFSTKYWDAETGMGWWGYRYYHPDQGRWMSRDPIGERGDKHLSAYVNNSPVVYVDFKGLASSSDQKAVESLINYGQDIGGCCSGADIREAILQDSELKKAVVALQGKQKNGRTCLSKIGCAKSCPGAHMLANGATCSTCSSTVKAAYSLPTSGCGSVSVCSRTYGVNPESLALTLKHELQHAFQCGGKDDFCDSSPSMSQAEAKQDPNLKKRCRNRLLGEIEACVCSKSVGTEDGKFKSCVEDMTAAVIGTASTGFDGHSPCPACRHFTQAGIFGVTVADVTSSFNISVQDLNPCFK